VGRFEALLPSLQAAEGSPPGLRAALPEAGDAAAWEGLATILDIANAEIAAGARVTFDPTLVRGMGYYTGPIFEIAAGGYPSSIAGGGRYDRMIGRMLGRDVPASGFSIGFERLISILAERGRPVPPAGRADARRVALLVDDRTADLAGAVRAAKRLRAEGYLVSLETRRKNMKKQLDDLLTHGFWGHAAHEPGAAEPTVKPLTRRSDGP
jgi:histidyl-tRNA synthetase